MKIYEYVIKDDEGGAFLYHNKYYSDEEFQKLIEEVEYETSFITLSGYIVSYRSIDKIKEHLISNYDFWEPLMASFIDYQSVQIENGDYKERTNRRCAERTFDAPIGRF